MRSSDSLAHEVQLLLEDEPQVLFEHRVSRSDVKKKSLMLITDFFKNSQIPHVGDMILVAAVEECAEWKRYVEQDLDEAEILREMNDIVDEEDVSIDEEAIARGVENFKLDGKLYVMSGLQSNTARRGKEMFEFPLPQGEGLALLNTQNDFKLPWSIYCPVVEGDREIVEWTHNLKRCQWMAPAINKKKQPLNSCNCLGSGCGKDCLNRAVQYECSASNCPFKHEDCGNRLFTNLLRDLSEHRLYTEGFEIRKTEKKGCGLFSIRSYNAGSLIVEYTGEVVDLTEVERRVNTIYKNFTDYYFLRLERNLVIDAGQRGSAARFVNHSCDANCEMQKWSVDNSPRIGLFAKRQIKVGEEISYDYNFEWGSDPQRCFCGAKNCRGFIGKKPDQEPEFNEAVIDNEADEADEIISEPRKNRPKKNAKKKKPVVEDEDDSESDDLIFDDALEEMVDDGTEVEVHSKNEIPHAEDDLMETIEDDKEGVEVAIERSSRKRALNPEVTHSGKKQKFVRDAGLSRIGYHQSDINAYAEVPAKLRRELGINMVGEKLSENIENQESDEEPPVKKGSRSRKKFTVAENEVDAAEPTKAENSTEPILIEDEPKVMKPEKTKPQKINDREADSSYVNENEAIPLLRSRRKTQVAGNDDNEVKFQDDAPRAHSAARAQLRKSRSKTPVFRRRPFLGKKAIFNREVSEKMTKTPKSKSINIFGEDLSKLKKSKRSSVSEPNNEGKYHHDNYEYNSQGYDSESQRGADGHYQQDQYQQQNQDTQLYSQYENSVPDSSQQSNFHAESNNGNSGAFNPDSEANEIVAPNSPEFKKKRRDPRKRG
jgi:hypothetical protein